MTKYLINVDTEVSRVYQLMVEAETPEEAIVEARERYIDRDWDDMDERVVNIQILDEYNN